MALSEKQVKAVRLAVTSEMTQEQIATAVGVHRTTIVSWFKKPEIKSHMEKVRKAVEQDSEDYIIRVFEDLRTGLFDIFKDSQEQTYNKIKAAELLMKAAGLFKQKTEITVNQTREKLNRWLEDSAEANRLIEDSKSSS